MHRSPRNDASIFPTPPPGGPAAPGDEVAAALGRLSDQPLARAVARRVADGTLRLRALPDRDFARRFPAARLCARSTAARYVSTRWGRVLLSDVTVVHLRQSTLTDQSTLRRALGDYVDSPAGRATRTAADHSPLPEHHDDRSR